MHDFHLRIVEAREASVEFITHLKMFIGLSRIISSSFRSECEYECLQNIPQSLTIIYEPERDHTSDKSDENKVCSATIKLSRVVMERHHRLASLRFYILLILDERQSLVPLKFYCRMRYQSENYLTDETFQSQIKF